MEKFLIQSKDEYKTLISKFGSEIEFDEEIKEPKNYPCIVIVSFHDDIEFGEYYQIMFINLSDFNKA